MKNAAEFLQYLREHPDKGREMSALSDDAFTERALALGFICTRAEIIALMEAQRELDEDDLDSASGGVCSGHCGVTCEEEYHPDPSAFIF